MADRRRAAGATAHRIFDALSDGGEAEAAARSIVLRQLTAGPRSRAQLAARLVERGTDDDVTQRVLDRLEGVGLIDDAEFARTWVRSRHTTLGLSRRALAHELRGKGVDDELASEALGAIDGDVERQAAEQLVARRLRTVRGLPRHKQVTRLAGMLARKGYGVALTTQVVLAALGDAAADDVDERSGDDGD